MLSVFHKPVDKLKLAARGKLSFEYLNSIASPQEKWIYGRRVTEWNVVDRARIYTSYDNRYNHESYVDLKPSQFSSWKVVPPLVQKITGAKDLSSLRITEYHIKVDLIGVTTDQIIREINPLWFRDAFTYKGYNNLKKGKATRKVIKSKLAGTEDDPNASEVSILCETLPESINFGSKKSSQVGVYDAKEKHD